MMIFRLRTCWIIPILLAIPFSGTAQKLSGSLKSQRFGVHPVTLTMQSKGSTARVLCESPYFGKKPLVFITEEKIDSDRKGDESLMIFRTDGDGRGKRFYEQGSKRQVQLTPGRMTYTYLTTLEIAPAGSGDAAYYVGTLKIFSKTRQKIVANMFAIPEDSVVFNVVVYPEKPRPKVASAPVPKPVPAPSKPPPAPVPSVPATKLSPPFDTTGYFPLYWWKGSELTMEVWDNFDIDGDAVTVQWNGDAPVPVVLARAPKAISLSLSPQKVHTLKVMVSSEGISPGATVSVRFSGGANKPINLTATGSSGQVYLLYFAQKE